MGNISVTVRDLNCARFLCEKSIIILRSLISDDIHASINNFTLNLNESLIKKSKIN